MVVFMVVVVGIMLMQMVQNDRLYNRVSTLLKLLERQYAMGSFSQFPTTQGGSDPSTAADQRSLYVPESEPGGTVTIAYGAHPKNLNPITYKDYYAGKVLYSGGIYLSLLQRDPDTLELQGLIADDWEISEDKLQLTFRLKPEVVWSDGQPLTAHDVAFSYRAMMIPTVDAQRIQTYYLDVENVEAVDDYTVRFIMKKRYFKSLEMAGGMTIVPKHVIDPDGLIDSDPEELAKRINSWNAFWDGNPPVTNGPYLLHEWDKTAQRIELRRNPKYWGEVTPLHGLVFKFISNDVARLQELKSEKVDVLMRLTPEQWENETNDAFFLERFYKTRYTPVTSGYNYIGYNQRRKPFDEKLVRQALSYCVPRELILEKIFYNLRELANGPFGSDSPQSSPDVGQWPYDPEKAKTLLAEAGFKDVDGDGVLDRDGEPFEFTISIPSGLIAYQQITEILQDELRKVGVDMTIEPYEWSVYEEKLSERDYEVCMLGWGGVVESDPYQIWHSSSMANRGSNHIGFSNEEVDRLIEEARLEFDRDKRNAKYQRIHEIIFELQPYTFLFETSELVAHHKRVANVTPHRLSMDFMEWWIPFDQRRTQE